MRHLILFQVFLLTGCDAPSRLLEEQAAEDLKKIENQVAEDAVKQYGIASRNGGPMDKCVNAGMVAAAYLQANDERKYGKWKQVEKTDCAAAGMPQ